jgi:hypothetical protein
MNDADAQRGRSLRIDQMLADIEQKLADRDRKCQEIRLAPWQLAFSRALASAPVMGAGPALGVFLTRLM